MANAADGYLGDWLPHKEKCWCTDCQLERAQREIIALKADNATLREQVSRLSAPVSDEDFVRQLIGIITWQEQVIHSSHESNIDNCDREICKCANLILNKLTAARLEGK